VYEQVRQAVHTPTPPQPSAAGGSGADAGAAEKRGGKKEAVAAGVSGGGAEFAFALLARAVMANQQHHDAVPPRVRQTVHVSVDKRYNQHGGATTAGQGAWAVGTLHRGAGLHTPGRRWQSGGVQRPVRQR